MSHRTVVASSFDEYLASEDDSVDERAAQEVERKRRMATFPYGLMLKVSFAELDFAVRWCWQSFGPCDGECTQRFSMYRVCHQGEPHAHAGKWTSHWFVKTEYDFGFNEWYFAESADRDRFVANADNINWGERFAE